jgi:hypothetical protein
MMTVAKSITPIIRLPARKSHYEPESHLSRLDTKTKITIHSQNNLIVANRILLKSHTKMT